MSGTLSRLWMGPLVIAVASLGGLVTALVADGAADWIGVVGLAIPALYALGLWLLPGRFATTQND
ncbi:MAG: hypothetical protein AAF648_06865 [Pseudomonadota bacterium]